MSITIRPLEARDAAAWRALWGGYCTFYEVAIHPDVTAATWARLLDPDAAMFGLVACDDEDRPVGLANCVLHLNTWTRRPVCYLEDLFVAPAARGGGAGRALIAALVEQGKREGWHRIYWMTRADNREARALYDKVGQLTDWVRYDVPL